MSKAALRFGVLAAVLAALQPWLLLLLGEPDTASLGALAADPATSQRHFWIMLACIPAMFAAYGVASLERFTPTSLCAAIAPLAFAVWFVLEMGPRSFDLWVVQGRWLPAHIAAAPEEQAALDRSYGLYRDALFALVFVRRHALLLGQLCLALEVRRHGPWGLALASALGLSVFRLALGSLATYAGWGAAGAIADPLYFVTSGLVFPLLAVWLWRRSLRPAATAAPG